MKNRFFIVFYNDRNSETIESLGIVETGLSFNELEKMNVIARAENFLLVREISEIGVTVDRDGANEEWDEYYDKNGRLIDVEPYTVQRGWIGASEIIELECSRIEGEPLDANDESVQQDDEGDWWRIDADSLRQYNEYQKLKATPERVSERPRNGDVRNYDVWYDDEWKFSDYSPTTYAISYDVYFEAVLVGEDDDARDIIRERELIGDAYSELGWDYVDEPFETV